MATMSATSNQRMRIRKAFMEEVIDEVYGAGVAKKKEAFRSDQSWSGLIDQRLRFGIMEEAYAIAEGRIGHALQAGKGDHGGWASLCRDVLKEEPGLAVPEPSRLLVPGKPVSVEEEQKRAEAVAQMKAKGVEVPA